MRRLQEEQKRLVLADLAVATSQYNQQLLEVRTPAHPAALSPARLVLAPLSCSVHSGTTATAVLLRPAHTVPTRAVRALRGAPGQAGRQPPGCNPPRPLPRPQARRVRGALQSAHDMDRVLEHALRFALSLTPRRPSSVPRPVAPSLPRPLSLGPSVPLFLAPALSLPRPLTPTRPPSRPPTLLYRVRL